MKQVAQCRNKCAQTNGCRFFIFGINNKKGQCYWEKTNSASCPQGWETDNYDFYEIGGGKFGQRGGRFETDAIRVGKCRSSDTDIRNCHDGGNAYSSVATDYCGARVNGRKNIGQKVVCYGNKIGVVAAPSQCNGEVSLYEHSGFNGKEVKFGKGNYNIGAMTQKGQKNDDVTSLKVPNGCRAILYQHGSFDGYGIEFGPGNYNHGAMTQRGVRNDDVSSLKVD